MRSAPPPPRPAPWRRGGGAGFAAALAALALGRHGRQPRQARLGRLGRLGRQAPQGWAVWIEPDFAAAEAGAPYGPGLDLLGLPMERLVILRVARQREALWAMEEALKCRAVSAVVAEIRGQRPDGDAPPRAGGGRRRRPWPHPAQHPFPRNAEHGGDALGGRVRPQRARPFRRARGAWGSWGARSHEFRAFAGQKPPRPYRPVAPVVESS
jgi:hypothetical protein